MTRVLQIRRGTTQQNNNFTGMIGEITMDTDEKTLRVHDGETLGGFAIARADMLSEKNIDPNTIPDEVWQSIFDRFTPKPYTVTETRPFPINSKCSYLDYIIGGTQKPLFIQVALVCTVAEAGYNTGDEVWAFGIGNRTNPQPNWIIDQDGLHVCLMVGKQKYWASHRDTGDTTELTDENWSVFFRVYC
ncbi:MAG: hypothetical protein IKW57_00710 [Alphaproteobacteria bacterium]|nr:hypothetical protein [Alphaproteobacteria bacterium]